MFKEITINHNIFRPLTYQKLAQILAIICALSPANLSIDWIFTQLQSFNHSNPHLFIQTLDQVLCIFKIGKEKQKYLQRMFNLVCAIRKI